MSLHRFGKAGIEGLVLLLSLNELAVQ